MEEYYNLYVNEKDITNFVGIEVVEGKIIGGFIQKYEGMGNQSVSTSSGLIRITKETYEKQKKLVEEQNKLLEEMIQSK